VSSLPALQEAVESLSEWMAGPGLAC